MGIFTCIKKGIDKTFNDVFSDVYSGFTINYISERYFALNKQEDTLTIEDVKNFGTKIVEKEKEIIAASYYKSNYELTQNLAGDTFDVNDIAIRRCLLRGVSTWDLAQLYDCCAHSNCRLVFSVDGVSHVEDSERDLEQLEDIYNELKKRIDLDVGEKNARLIIKISKYGDNKLCVGVISTLNSSVLGHNSYHITEFIERTKTGICL